MHKGLDALAKSATDFKLSETEASATNTKFQQDLWMKVANKISETVSDSMMMLKLRTRFEKIFRYDDDGVPRMWKPSDDIDTVFKRAKTEVRSIHVMELTWQHI